MPNNDDEISLSLNISAKQNNYAVSTRADESETATIIDDIYIMVFEEDEGGNRKIAYRYYFNSDDLHDIITCDAAHSSYPNAKWNRTDNSISHMRVKSTNCYIMALANVKHNPSIITLDKLEGINDESELRKLTQQTKDYNTNTPLLAGYYVDANTDRSINPTKSDPIIAISDGANGATASGTIVLQSPMSQNYITITSLENRFTLLSYELVNLPTACSVFNNVTGWEQYADVSSLPLERSAELTDFVKYWSDAGKLSYDINFYSAERKNMDQCAAFKETDTITSRMNYIRYVVDGDKSTLSPTYVKFNGIFRRDTVVLGCIFYLALGDLKKGMKEFDVLRNREYQYKINVKDVYEVETYLVDLPNIDYFKFTTDGLQTFTIAPIPSGMQYRVDTKEGEGLWTTLTTTPIAFGEKDTLLLRNTNKNGTGNSKIVFGNENVPVTVSGDIRTLVDWKATGTYQEVNWRNAKFESLFKHNKAITDAYGLYFPNPARDFNSVKRKYMQMFMNCTNLVRGPEVLHAKYGTDNDYDSMFEGCTKLTETPIIQMTHLGVNSCHKMFYGCTSLKEGVVYKWNIEKSNTYGLARMFQGCTSLESALTQLKIEEQELSQGILQSTFEGCTSLKNTFKDLPNLYIRKGTYQETFNGCTSLETAPNIGAKYYMDPTDENCMHKMFYNCKNLTTPPKELNLVSPQKRAYSQMFENCTSLTTAPIIRAENLPHFIEFYDRKDGEDILRTPMDVMPNDYTNAVFPFYGMFSNTGIKEFTLSADEIIAEPTSELVLMNREMTYDEKRLHRIPWRATYQLFNMNRMGLANSSNITLKVKTQTIKDKLKANGCVPSNWNIVVEP